jgi:hypothetical protein
MEAVARYPGGRCDECTMNESVELQMYKPPTRGVLCVELEATSFQLCCLSWLIGEVYSCSIRMTMKLSSSVLDTEEHFHLRQPLSEVESRSILARCLSSRLEGAPVRLVDTDLR